MAQSTFKVVLILAVIFLSVVGATWIYATSASSGTDVITEDTNNGPAAGEVALNILPPPPVTGQEAGG